MMYYVKEIFDSKQYYRIRYPKHILISEELIHTTVSQFKPKLLTQKFNVVVSGESYHILPEGISSAILVPPS